MRRLILCGTTVLLVLAVRHASAQVTKYSGVGHAGSQNAPAAQPGSSATRAPLTLGTPQRASPIESRPAGNRRDHSRHRHGGHHRRRPGWWLNVGFPWFPDDPYVPGYPLYFPPYRYVGYSVVLPPLSPPVGYIAAPVGAGAVPPGRPVNDAAAPVPARQEHPAKPKTSHAQQKARAGRFIGFGDANFAKANYNSAVERYKTAITIAPDVAESYFRQAFAYVAMGHYDKAAAAFRRGLRIRSDWNGSPVRLAQIYGPGALAKTAHIESLAGAVEANPFDAELLLDLGMQLFFDGQPDRAEVFFARVAQLGGNEDGLLDDFLPKPKPDGAADPKPKVPGKVVF